MTGFAEVVIGDSSTVIFREECAFGCDEIEDLKTRNDVVGLGVIKALGSASRGRCPGPVLNAIDGEMTCGITTPDWMKKSNNEEE